MIETDGRWKGIGCSNLFYRKDAKGFANGAKKTNEFSLPLKISSAVFANDFAHFAVKYPSSTIND
jgi:hypothetical protein